MDNLFIRWKKAIDQKRFWFLCLIGFLLLIFGLVLTGVSSSFADAKRGASLSDLILDQIPAVNLDILTTWGFLLIIFSLLITTLVYQPGELPFVMITVALFVSVRSGFIALTHLGAPADILKISWNNGILKYFSFTNDLFFSGHTGLPYLACLLANRSWQKKFFLSASFVMAASVLLTHTHYSIDVFGAYFITYGVYKIAERFFGHLRSPIAVAVSQ